VRQLAGVGPEADAGARARTAASASMPFWSGIETSSRSTWTSPWRTMSMASRPLLPSATTRRLTCSERYWRSPLRTMAWSSMMATLIMVRGASLPDHPGVRE